MKIKQIEKKAICLVMAICAVLCLCIGIISVSMRANAETASSSSEKVQASVNFTTMGISAAQQMGFETNNLATDANGHTVYGAVPGAQWGGLVSGGNASVTYTLDAGLGHTLSGGTLSLDVLSGHQGGVYWYNNDKWGEVKLGANLTVSVSTDTYDWTQIFDLQDCNPGVKTQDCIPDEVSGIPSGKHYVNSDNPIALSQGNGQQKLYIKIEIKHFTAAETKIPGWENGIPLNKLGLFLYKIDIVSEVECSNNQLKEVAEKPATVYAEGVKAHYVCETCRRTYLLNESGEYTAVNAEDLRIERLTGFLGANITLNNNLDFKYYAYVGGTPTSVQAEFTMDGKTTIVDGVKEGEQYVFVFKKLGPQNVGKEIKARLLVDGVEKDVKVYSADKYLYEVFKKSDTDEANKKLIADIFEYCAAAQAYLDETETGTPVNELYPDVAACKTKFVAPETTDRALVENATVEGFTFTAANLKISSEVQMLFKFNAGDGYKLVVNGIDVTNKVVTHADGSLVYYTDGVSVVDFDKVFTAELYSGETLVQTVKYSVNSYVYSKYGSNNTELANMVKCLYNYGLSAEKIA